MLEERRVEWRVLSRGAYRLLKRDQQGVLRSTVFPGMWLDEAALWTGDADRMLQLLETGLASEECRHFLAKLKRS